MNIFESMSLNDHQSYQLLLGYTAYQATAIESIDSMDFSCMTGFLKGLLLFFIARNDSPLVQTPNFCFSNLGRRDSRLPLLATYFWMKLGHMNKMFSKMCPQKPTFAQCEWCDKTPYSVRRPVSSSATYKGLREITLLARNVWAKYLYRNNVLARHKALRTSNSYKNDIIKYLRIKIAWDVFISLRNQARPKYTPPCPTFYASAFDILQSVTLCSSTGL